MQFTSASPPGDRLFAALVGLGYLVAGLVWIGFTDQAGGLLFATSEALTRFQTWKGTGFVALSAVLVFLLTARAGRQPALPAGGRSRAGLGTLLLALVLVTAVPLVTILGYNVLRETRASAQEAEALAQGLADATHARVQAYLEDRKRLAQRLAQRSAQVASAKGGCDAMLPEVTLLLEDITDAQVLGADGAMLCSARGGAGVRVTAAQLQAEQDLQVSAPSNQEGPPVVALIYPVRSGGQVTGSVQLQMAAARLQRMAAGGATGAVSMAMVTLSGRSLARAPAKAPGAEDLATEGGALAKAARDGRATVLLRGADGHERFHALRRVTGTNVVVAAGIDMDETFGAVRQQVLRALAGGALVLLAAALLLAAIVRRIANPMRALAQAAEAVGAGDFARRAPEAGPVEVARVAVEFNRMLDRLPVLESRLRESEERHRTLLDKLSHNVPGMIFQLCMDVDGRTWMPFASEASIDMLELTPAEIGAEGARAVAGRIHPDDLPEAVAAFRRSRTRLTRVDLRHRVVLPGRGVRHYLTAAQPERQPQGACLWYGCTIDVTTLEEARVALRQANETLEARVDARTRELAAANESLESFSFSVAHDLRAPLAAIEGFTGALPAALARGDAERVERLADRVGANTRQMGAMIDGLLAVARAGKGELQEAPVNLQRMVASVLAELAPAPALGFQLGPLPTVRADAATLRQVWWNLLANAAKFTAGQAQGCIAVACEQQGHELVFSVRDNGVGFDPQHADRLFWAFQRLHDAREFEGTGIGLALVRRVVERHGGRVWAEGSPGAGATFSFSLPASRLQTDPSP